MKSLPILIRSLFCDYRRLLPGVKGLDRDLITIEARFENEGVGFLTVALPNLGKALDQGLSLGRFTCPIGFAKKGTIPRFLSGMFCEVFDTSTGLLKSNVSIECIRCIREICYFFKKFAPTPDKNELLTRRAFADFVDTDNSIRAIAPFRLERVSRVANFVLEDLDFFNELDCRHGPGAVAEGLSANQKWKHLSTHLLSFDESLNFAGYDVVSSLYHDQLSSEYSSSPLSPYCRIVAVPKSSVALRTITVEPCLNQFVQQGFNEHLRRSIERDYVLSRCLSLTDQSKNQHLALEGSRTGDWVTIDLSSASDLLSLELVKAVFANRPRFLSGILKCRTPSVDVGNAEIYLKKYAGMGNATTFPIQSVVFALLALTAIVGDKRLTKRTLRSMAECIRVYGDDIIVRSGFYPVVAEWITSCGLKINRSKTFSEGFFRESCGVDAYMGVDVTPVYLHHDPDLASTDVDAMQGIVSTSNQLWLSGRYSLANAIIKITRKKFPLVPRDSGCIGLHTRYDCRSIQKWNRKLHRFEFKAIVSVPKRKTDHLDGVSALMKFFHTPKLSEYDPLHLASSVRRFTSKPAVRWLPS